MNIGTKGWAEIGQLTGDDLKRRVFSVMRSASLSLNSGNSDDPSVLEVIPRLAELVPVRPELESFREAFSVLARAAGLWNYIDKETADTADALLAEAVTSEELGGVTLHREQIAALNDLLAGKNLILSAPTSFGKSLLIDALLASGQYRRVAIVLPTIALLDEFRRRLRRRFAGSFEVVMHPGDKTTDAPTIFLGTQERLINRTDLGTLDLTVVDEFYKLDPTRHDDRSITLNAAVYKLLSRSRQFFFLGPNIDQVRVAGDGRWKFEFLRTRFSTVAVDTFDLTQVEDKAQRLFEEIGEDANWPALVFVSSPDRANRLAADAAEQLAVSDQSDDFASWLSENVGANWSLVKTVRFGFGVHHGRIPRAIASHMVRLFNEAKLPVLFCTSTLIEGVNTAAKTVLIYDKAIARSNYDFFTFSNIKGRAGRLGQHHVGKVYLFNAPPMQESTEVAPTLFADDEDAPDDYVVHLDEAVTVRPEIDERIDALKQALELDSAGLKIAASVGLENALAIKKKVVDGLRGGKLLRWSGYPRYEHIGAIAEIVCGVRSPGEFGVFSAKQLTYFISSLRQTGSMKAFLNNYDAQYRGNAESHDNVFKFLRACEYGLPQLFSVIELFVKRHDENVDYSLFLHSLSRWFMPEELKNLDEEGVPIQISERYYSHGDTRAQLIEKLGRAAVGKSSMSSFERSWIKAALDITR